MKTNISIIYKHLLWADALHALINQSEAFHVSQVFAMSKVKTWVTSHSTFFVLEATYPNAELIDVLSFLKKSEQKVMIIGFHVDNDFVETLVELDLDAFVLKTCSKMSLFEALRQVRDGKKYFCAPITEALSHRLKEKSTGELLTLREKDVLHGLVSLRNSKQIAEKLNISMATVRTHRKNIMKKFGTKNYIGLLRYACREGMMDAPGEQFCIGCKKKSCQSTLLG